LSKLLKSFFFSSKHIKIVTQSFFKKRNGVKAITNEKEFFFKVGVSSLKIS